MLLLPGTHRPNPSRPSNIHYLPITLPRSPLCASLTGTSNERCRSERGRRGRLLLFSLSLELSSQGMAERRGARRRAARAHRQQLELKTRRGGASAASERELPLPDLSQQHQHQFERPSCTTGRSVGGRRPRCLPSQRMGTVLTPARASRACTQGGDGRAGRYRGRRRCRT
jgi:hypothetical protein